MDTIAIAAKSRRTIPEELRGAPTHIALEQQEGSVCLHPYLKILIMLVQSDLSNISPFFTSRFQLPYWVPSPMPSPLACIANLDPYAHLTCWSIFGKHPRLKQSAVPCRPMCSEAPQRVNSHKKCACRWKMCTEAQRNSTHGTRVYGGVLSDIGERSSTCSEGSVFS